MSNIYWEARFEGPDGDYLRVTISHTPDFYNEDYGIMVTSEMEARRLAEKANRKAAELRSLRGIGNPDPYKLVSLEQKP